MDNYKEVMAAATHNLASSPQKILWIRLFRDFEYDDFQASYEAIAEAIGSNKYTVRAQVKALETIGAMVVKRDGDRPGTSLLKIKLIKPSKWS